MNLPPPAPRRHMHTRSISCEGYKREDGLWDIDARIIDTKAYGYQDPFRGLREPGDPVHHMELRLTIDNDMVVHDIEVAMPSVPYVACASALPAFKGLIGRKIGAGWRRALQECVGGVKGCTHVRELLLSVATVAFQTLGGPREQAQPVPRSVASHKGKRPHFLDGCKAWALDGEIVAVLYPHFHRKK